MEVKYQKLWRGIKMKEKIVYRLCLICDVKKQTTVHLYERKNYVCEKCLVKHQNLILEFGKRMSVAREQGEEQAKDNYRNMVFLFSGIAAVAAVIGTLILMNLFG